MPKFVLKKLPDENNPADTATVVMVFDRTTIQGILSDFQNFLRASGFPMPKSHFEEIMDDAHEFVDNIQAGQVYDEKEPSPSTMAAYSRAP